MYCTNCGSKCVGIEIESPLLERHLCTNSKCRMNYITLKGYLMGVSFDPTSVTVLDPSTYNAVMLLGRRTGNE